MAKRLQFSTSAKAMLLGAICVLAPSLQASPWIIGNASSVQNGELLYRELHYRSDASALLSERVEYVSPSGELLVAKTLDASLSPITPNVEQKDLRTGTQFTIRHNGDSLDTSYQRTGERAEFEQIAKNEQLVVDAGFDPYVRANWDALQSEKTVRAQFFVPARLDAIKISIRKAESKHCADIAAEALCLVVRPAGALRLIGWLVEPLYLAYAQDSQRLLMYRGVSNLLDDEGNAQEVLIRYEYPGSAS